MSDAFLPPRSLDDPAASQAWLDALGSAPIDRQLAGLVALWHRVRDEEPDPTARWAGTLRFWPATTAMLDRATEILADRPLPMTAAGWVLVDTMGNVLAAMRDLAIRCLAEERDALFLGLDAQSRRLRLKMLTRVALADADWLDLLRMARLAQARGVMDRHGPMLEPRLPSARAMVARPLLLHAAGPDAMPVATLKVVDRIAGRLARRLALRIEAPGAPTANPLGATLAFGRAGTVLLDGRSLREHLERVVDAETGAADRRGENPAALADPGREIRRTTASPGWPALAKQLQTCWMMPSSAADHANDGKSEADPVVPLQRAALRAGPLGATLAPTVATGMAIDGVGGATVAGQGSMAGPGTVAGMPTALAIEYVYGRAQFGEHGRAAAKEERRQRREQHVIARLMAEGDLGFLVGLDSSTMRLDRTAPSALRLDGLLSVALGEPGLQRLVIGRLQACAHGQPQSDGLPPVQRLRIALWPGDARVVSLQISGDAWQLDAFYLPGVAGERPPSVVVGRGRCRSGETASLRLAENDMQIRFGDLLDQGPDFTRLAVSLVRG